MLSVKEPKLVQRNFDPRHRTARATALAISERNSYLIKTWWKRQRLAPLDETTVFRNYDFPRNIELLLEAGEPPAIINSDSQHINNRLLFAG